MSAPTAPGATFPALANCPRFLASWVCHMITAGMYGISDGLLQRLGMELDIGIRE